MAGKNSTSGSERVHPKKQAKNQRTIEKKQALAEAEHKAAEDKYYAIKDDEEQKALNRKVILRSFIVLLFFKFKR